MPITAESPMWRVRCCRDWPVLAHTRWNRCGYCGQFPVYVDVWRDDA
jgi:hypothetical protein